MRPEGNTRIVSAGDEAGRGAQAAWTLREDGLLVFERALGPAGPFRLLLMKPSFCVERRCDCRDVMFAAVGLEIATDLASARLTSEQLGSMLASAGAMHALIDIDFGEVRPDDYGGRAPLTAEWIDFVRSELDGEVLDQLYEQWLCAKGWRSREPHEIDWPERERGELVGWHEAYPDARPDLYADEEAVFTAAELYCANAKCDCHEAILDFGELGERKRARSIGHVRIRLSDARLLDVRGPRQRLERLWSAYRARHRAACDRLARRKRHMAELAKLHADTRVSRPVVTTSRVGRNDPCSCGSGKKYKRCCAGRPALGSEGTR